MTITSKQISWTKIVPKGDPTHGSPVARSSHGVSMVQKGSRLVVLGGENVARTPIDSSNSCWTAHTTDGGSSWQWQLISAEGGPPDRIAHAQAASEDKHVYVFGGRAGITMEEKAMNDLWLLDCSGEPGTENWSEVKAASGAAPEARSFHRMICIGKSLFVFGGCSAAHGRLADLHRFDLETNTWHDLGTSNLRGRGGPNLMPLSSATKIGVVAGFAGEETKDGQIFDLAAGKWNDAPLGAELEGMRPRSVCVCGSFPSHGVSVIFGGEIDPSDRGHEGAGGFENDLVVLDEKTASYVKTFKSEPSWPQTRGWSDAAVVDSAGKSGLFYVFGGLSGDDKNPERLDDLWVLKISK